MPVSDENKAYAEKVADLLAKRGLRVERDFDSGTIGGKIRNAQLQKVPFAIVVGSKESDAQTISVRSRDGKVRQDVLLEDFVKEVDEKVQTYA